VPKAPYEQTFRHDGNLCFFAPVPALAHIGQRFEELSDASFHYQAPEGEQHQWRQLVHRLEILLEQARSGSLQSWSAIHDQLNQEFQEAFVLACGRVSRYVQEYFDTGQMPLTEYLEWIIHGAETMWSLNGGQGLDMNRFQTRVDRLTQRLQSSNYESELDRRLREQDPQRYEFLTNSMQLMLGSLNDADPQAHERMIAQQMELFRQSPMFGQAQQSMVEMRKRLESLRDTDPELYAQQMRGLEETQRFWENPAAAMQDMTTDDVDQVDTVPDHEVKQDAATTPPGQLLFSCGRCETINAEQIVLYQQFVDRQETLRPAIERALREMHRWMQPATPFSWPGDRVLFPENPNESDIPLHCFRIQQVGLLPKPGGCIVLDLDSQFGHFDEHGCSLLIRNGRLERYGTWDDVFGDGEFEGNEE
jgi:hypothetical protein